MNTLNKEIIYNKRISAGYYRMALSWNTPLVKPGQFVMLRSTGSLDPLLRRPLGIYNVIGSNGKGAFRGDAIELLYRVVGRGTELLSAKKPGDTVDVLGPLGNGFPVSKAGDGDVIMVAGGMGVVPLYLLAKSLEGGVLLFGCRSKAEAVLTKDFRAIKKKIAISTEDGSVGRQGFVTELLEQELTPRSVVYACGPSGMLKETARLSEQAGARCYVSLERPMACGIGVCLGCAVKAKNHTAMENRDYRMVCSEGPVFDSRDIDWEAF